jgi:hypothetical protein
MARPRGLEATGPHDFNQPSIGVVKRARVNPPGERPNDRWC